MGVAVKVAGDENNYCYNILLGNTSLLFNKIIGHVRLCTYPYQPTCPKLPLQSNSLTSVRLL